MYVGAESKLTRMYCGRQEVESKLYSRSRIRKKRNEWSRGRVGAESERTRMSRIGEEQEQNQKETDRAK